MVCVGDVQYKVLSLVSLSLGVPFIDQGEAQGYSM